MGDSNHAPYFLGRAATSKAAPHIIAFFVSAHGEVPVFLLGAACGYRRATGRRKQMQAIQGRGKKDSSGMQGKR